MDFEFETARTGMCCWNDDSDGVMPLDSHPDDRAAIASSAAQEAK